MLAAMSCVGASQMTHRYAALKPTEHQVQAAYFDLVRLHRPNCKLIYAVPNAAKRSYALARRMQREGLKSGSLDVNIDIPAGEYHGMRIEFKRDVKGELSDEQRETWDQLVAQGYHCELHWDAVTAWNQTCRYLSRARG
jgi:hypothetical protein